MQKKSGSLVVVLFGIILRGRGIFFFLRVSCIRLITHGSSVIEGAEGELEQVPVHHRGAVELHPSLAACKVGGDVAHGVGRRHQPQEAVLWIELLTVDKFVTSDVEVSGIVREVAGVVHHPAPLVQARHRDFAACNNQIYLYMIN